MFVVIKIGGKQYLVSESQTIEVERLKDKEGKKITMKEVLLFSDSNIVEVGQPFLNNILIEAKVIKHRKAKKIVVFKYKRRKGYRKKQGHRQLFTELVIEKITRAKPQKARKAPARKRAKGKTSGEKAK
jgi:large subunit ribosomal protein L21